jgi:hypothetical protein
MKTNISPALASFLNDLCTQGNGGNYGVIDLYTITLLSGAVLRLAAWAIPVVFGGHVYSAAGPYISRSRLVQALKLEVSQIKITILANPTMVIGSTSVLAAISAGLFAGAYVSVDRLFTPTVNPLDVSLGTLNWFTGNIAEIEECGRSRAVLSAKDPTALLSSDYPRNLYLTGCRHSFGDAGCTFNKSSVQASGIVQAGSTSVTIKTNLTQAGGLPAPTAAPVLSDSGDQTDVNLSSQTYFVRITFTGADGESGPGPENSYSVTGSANPNAHGTTDKLLIVAAPGSPPAGATGWNVYVGLASGQEQLQQSFVGFGTNWQQIGALAQGAPPPSLGTAGYFSQGVITFTSGALAGQSQVITDYQLVGGLGVITTSPPLSSTPAPGDTFVAVPDCGKTMAECDLKYNNLVHFGGEPFIPSPETSV